VRRAEVRKLLASREDVLEFHDAPPERGGMGATIVRLGEKG
jgi:DNA-nicking Smr family endonuclease